MIIYKVTEYKDYESYEEFFKSKEDARKYMEYRVNEYIRNRKDLFINVDIPMSMHLRFGDPDGDSGLFTMFDMTEIVVH